MRPPSQLPHKEGPDGQPLRQLEGVRAPDLSASIAAPYATLLRAEFGAGERFFCIGGRKEGMEPTTLYADTLPMLEMYDSLNRLQIAGDCPGQRFCRRRQQQAKNEKRAGARISIRRTRHR